MPIADRYTRKVTIARLDNGILPADQSMRISHVGDALVAGQRNGHGVSVSILTDHNPATVGLTAEEANVGIYEAVRAMGIEDIKHLPAANDNAEMTNIVILANLMAALAKELHAILEVIQQEQKKTL